MGDVYKCALVGLRLVGRAWLGSVLALSLVGCGDPDADRSYSEPSLVIDQERKSDLRQALGFLNNLDRYESVQAHEKIRYHLQQWLKVQPPDAAWRLDPLVAQLPTPFQSLVAEQPLSRLQMQDYDTDFLQEAVWLRDLARSIVSRSKIPVEINDWVTATMAAEEDGHGALLQAAMLFDWTWRNLHTDAPLTLESPVRFQSNLILYAWESLLLGRGTPAEKARVFTLLARQLGLPVVIISSRDAASDNLESAAVAGLFLNGDLFLFDMQVGLPVLTADRTRVATLAEVRDDPDGLQWSEDADIPLAYSLASHDLDQLVALIDATPTYLSQRMQVLENALVGEQKTVLTVQPARLAMELSQHEGITHVELWQLPYLAFERRSQLQQGQPAVVLLAAEHSLFDRRTPLMRGRVMHFRGQYEGTDEGLGARAFYMESRTPDEQIRSVRDIPLTTDASEQAAATQLELESHQRRLAFIEQLMTRTKQNASFWLGLMSYDRGDYVVSVNFLQKRLLEAYPDCIWADAARYNLGRAYEAMGRTQQDPEWLHKAKQTYQQVTTDSPWSDACRMRVAVLSG